VAKVSEPAARGVRAGHPWVFRESLLRPFETADATQPVRVVDADGRHLAWALPDPEGGAVALRVIERDEEVKWGPDLWRERLERALAFRARHLEPGITACCRLVHGEADGLPAVAVDRYADWLVVYKYSRVAEGFVLPLVELLQERVKPQGIYLQDRVRPVSAEDRRPPATHVAGKIAPPEVLVEEDGLNFVVDVTAPVSPGLFLDLREGRRMCERFAGDRRVLNLFSFTGSLGVRAVRGGASCVTNVDAAARSHARCRQNLQASGLDPESCENLTGDVFKHLERMRARGRLFDLVVADPPPFSHVKGGAPFSAVRDFGQLLRAIAPVVDRDGLVLAVSNAAKLPEGQFLAALGEGAGLAGRNARLIDGCGLPPDFPVLPAFGEGRYLQAALLHLP
jgi:23S rRNA (cytosine1962-C5)-methyltransferase